jgi:hypothetical protein
LEPGAKEYFLLGVGADKGRQRESKRDCLKGMAYEKSFQPQK